MKVALIYFRIMHAGGLERRLLNYTQWLIDKGHEVTIIHAKRDPTIILPQGVKLEKIELDIIPKPLRMLYFNFKLSIIMKHSIFDWSLSLGRTYSQQLVICPGTHIGHLKSKNRIPILPIDWINIFLDRRTYKRSQKILAASGKMKIEMEDFYKVPASKIKILYPPSDVSRFRQQKEKKQEFRKKWGFSPNEKILLFVAYSLSRKGLPLLKNVMVQLKEYNIRLVLCGSTKDKIFDENITHLGYVKEMEELFCLADITVHPSKYEAYGQIVTESILCGTPVLVLPNSGSSELVNKNVGLVIDDLDPTTWCNSILEMLNKEWQIEPGFAEKNGLTIDQHMEGILSEWRKITEKKI